MVFSSISFLFFFLPLLFLIYYLVPKKGRNYVLLLFSLLFYYWSEKQYLVLLLFSCLVSYLIGCFLGKKKKKSIFVLGILIHVGLLFYFKYSNFFLDNVTNLFGLPDISFSVILSLGISFFTFQNISYLVDVYQGSVLTERNFFTYCTYVTLFPQLVAGPIVRYQDVLEELKNRKESVSFFSQGIQRFILGLSKKVLIADSLFVVYE